MKYTHEEIVKHNEWAQNSATCMTPNWLDWCMKSVFIIQELLKENKRYRAALENMVYETTHLSPLEDDGSHKCRISKVALAQAREALKEEA